MVIKSNLFSYVFFYCAMQTNTHNWSVIVYSNDLYHNKRIENDETTALKRAAVTYILNGNFPIAMIHVRCTFFLTDKKMLFLKKCFFQRNVSSFIEECILWCACIWIVHWLFNLSFSSKQKKIKSLRIFVAHLVVLDSFLFGNVELCGFEMCDSKCGR